MKIIFRFVFMVVFLSTFLVADEQQYIKKNFETIIENIISIAKNNNLTKDERNAEVVNVVTPMFDFVLMGKLSLGKKWKLLNTQDKKRFIELYVQRMKKSYSSKLDSFDNNKVIIKDIKQLKSNRIVLFSSLVQSSGNDLDVVYKYYKPKTPKANKFKWLVYDVEVQGVSILKTDKAQFKEYLKNHRLSQLMDSMQ